MMGSPLIFLGVEESPVGGEAALPQGGQVAQPFADRKIAGCR